MGKVILNLSMSLDGFIAGPHIRPEEPMGDGGEKLHDWMFQGGQSEDQVNLFENTAAFIMGERTFQLGVENWGDNPAFHAPCFVLAKEPRETITKQGGTSYIFVADGLQSALSQARAAAGNKDVTVMGGANAAQQYLNAGLLDELYIHLAHILLGDGTKLFDNLTIKPTDLEKIAVADAKGVTHLRFRIRK